MPAFDVEPLYAYLGNRMRDERKARDLTQAQVGDRIGMTASAVTYYEKGVTRIRMIEFVQWCRALSIEPGALLTELCRDVPALFVPGQQRSPAVIRQRVVEGGEG